MYLLTNYKLYIIGTTMLFPSVCYFINSWMLSLSYSNIACNHDFTLLEKDVYYRNLIRVSFMVYNRSYRMNPMLVLTKMSAINTKQSESNSTERTGP